MVIKDAMISSWFLSLVYLYSASLIGALHDVSITSPVQFLIRHVDSHGRWCRCFCVDGRKTHCYHHLFGLLCLLLGRKIWHVRHRWGYDVIKSNLRQLTFQIGIRGLVQCSNCCSDCWGLRCEHLEVSPGFQDLWRLNKFVNLDGRSHL